MNNLLILGAGGHGKVLADTAQATGNWSEICFADDLFPELTTVNELPVICELAGVVKLRERFQELAIAIGDNQRRLDVYNEFADQGFDFPVLVHPSAYVSPAAILGDGCVVFANAVVQASAELDVACIVNTAATVDHDNKLGKAVHLSPGTHLGGDVRIGSCSFLGTGVSVIRGVSIGDHVIAGAGAAIVNDIPAHSRVAGVPAKPMEDEK